MQELTIHPIGIIHTPYQEKYHAPRQPGVDAGHASHKKNIIGTIELFPDKNFDQALEYLIDARFDCMRARHDAVDTTVSTAAAEIKAVTDRVGHDVVIRGFPEYSKLITLISDSQVKIASSRFNRNNREAIYANRGQAKIVEGAVVSVDFTSLVVLYRSFQANENVTCP